MQVTRWLAPALVGSFVTLAQTAWAATIQENFSTNPSNRGWRVFGETNLFTWDTANQDLQVTWDSSKPNSYFYHSLGTVLGRDDDFSMAFDLRLNDIGPGLNTNKSGAFEVAIALLNFSEAADTNFLRGTGTNSPNLIELDYFRDAGFGATIWPTFISSNSVFNYNGLSDYTLLGLATGDLYHIVMSYTASNSTLITTMTQNGSTFGPINSVPLSTNFTDFRVDTFAVCSYSDVGDDFDSLLAHGTLAKLVITTPPPPLAGVSGGFVAGDKWQVQFTGRSNWLYTLQRTTDFQTWTSASSTVSGGLTNQVLQDAAPTSARAFYRVRAHRP
jgi:hypothetical protein